MVFISIHVSNNTWVKWEAFLLLVLVVIITGYYHYWHSNVLLVVAYICQNHFI